MKLRMGRRLELPALAGKYSMGVLISGNMEDPRSDEGR